MEINDDQHRASLYELMKTDALFKISDKVKAEADALEKLREIAGEFPEYKPPSYRR